MSLDYALITQQTIQMAREAGAVLRHGFTQHKQIERKSSALDWVTQYDTECEQLLLYRLQELFPTHSIIGEEGSNVQGSEPYQWYVDPLDGTVNFAHGLPIFTVSLGLYQGSTPLVGVVYQPMTDECFYSWAGGGAYLAQDGQITQLKVSHMNRLQDGLLATGFPYDRHTSEQDNMRQTHAFLKRGHGIRRLGSAALDLCYVAAGRFDGYWEFKLHSWDVAAGVLMVQEAGGRVSLVYGEPFAMSPRLALVASNGHLHDMMVDVLKWVG